ncbi:MAG: sugar ABC transporter substrate-binding protein, partial [Chloroflexi bacterium]|nr:sugar ABC transporter substrate-binding protein [Chloroflexota bacterium]
MLKKIVNTLLIATMLLLSACSPATPAPATEAPAAAPAATTAPVVSDTVVKAETGKAIDMVLLPKFLGIAVFDEANQGAQEAHKELGNTGKLEFLGPTPENSV